MQPGEALGVAAQVAVTLAGFAGIVVVFRPESVHQWSALDRFRLSLLLMNSALPLGLSMFGMLMLSVEPAPASIWRWCSGVAFAAEVTVFTFMPNPRRRLSAVDLQAVNKWLFYGIGLIAAAAAALQVIKLRSLEPVLAVLRGGVRASVRGAGAIPSADPPASASLV